MESILSFAIISSVAYGARSIEWTSDRVLYARIAFGAIQAITLLFLFLIRRSIVQRNDSKTIKIKPKPEFGQT